MMAFRIDVRKTVQDSRASTKLASFKGLELSQKPTSVCILDAYVVDADVSEDAQGKIARALMNPIVEDAMLNGTWAPEKFSYAIEIGYRPGVTDNVGHTCKEMIEDLLGMKFSEGAAVYTSKVYFVGDISGADARRVADSLHNPLIESCEIKSQAEFVRDRGFGAHVQKVALPKPEETIEVDLEVSDEELIAIGKQGIMGPGGTRRGPLALDIVYMRAIRDHFKTVGRKPTDIELETLAQSWSEHCKHTILSSPIGDVEKGIFKTYIKGATEKIRKERGDKDICVSVFKDNSGAIVFDDEYLVTHKVETHNSPSALDPFGGAITGIVGVNRDALGFGLGAKPIANTFGFCLADPRDERVLYRDASRKEKMLSARRIMDGVIAGVHSGGNQSGIPTPHGFLTFEPRYRGKPLVFAGTMGLIPRKSPSGSRGEPRNLYEKSARAGDYIVMMGGRVGQDGIHGATFSSEAIDAGSPATAVQIGDPITQKKFSDALIREARDAGLYTSITDDGAGGLSSSIGEMAKESGGCLVDLDKVPLKYPGLAAWQIWISESQERMTLAVPPERWSALESLMKKRGVEVTAIGTFTDSGRCVVTSGGKTVMDLDLEFLHEGTPVRALRTKVPALQTAPEVPVSKKIVGDMLEMLARPTIASRAFIARQYDHEVQSTSVLKPLQGPGQVDGDAAVIRPVLTSKKGVVVADALYPTYSDIDTYHMAAAGLDGAVRAAIAAGASLDHLALLDNFCWCSPFDETRLYELERAGRACYDIAVAYGTPFVSGKDSMFNDFKGFDEHGPVEISVPPTMLGTAFGVVEDIERTVSVDFKSVGDLVYVLGETHAELGGSEYSGMVSERENKKLGGRVPQVSMEKNKVLYETMTKATKRGLLASALSVGRGGLGIALSKASLGAGLGGSFDLSHMSGDAHTFSDTLFSESQGRFVVSVAVKNKAEFEKLFSRTALTCVGKVQKNSTVVFFYGKSKISLPLQKIRAAYQGTFKSF
jgi:phosphoribosylformylglycinamidine synthase subunit PurSL